MYYILSGFRVYLFTGSNSKKRAKKWLKKIKTNIMGLSVGQFNSIWFSPKAFVEQFGNCVMVIDHSENLTWSIHNNKWYERQNYGGGIIREINS